MCDLCESILNGLLSFRTLYFSILALAYYAILADYCYQLQNISPLALNRPQALGALRVI